MPAQLRPGAPASAAPAGSGPGGDARVAEIGVLDKRLGRTRVFTLRPGERFRFGQLAGILRTCERTAPWERPALSGAFVQLVEMPRAVGARAEERRPRPIFSGWLFAESPSLNPVRHPVYDVWLKSCTMSFPESPPAGASAAARPAASGAVGGGA